MMDDWELELILQYIRFVIEASNLPKWGHYEIIDTHKEKYKCHICKHLHTDKTLKVYCDINGVDFLKKYYDCENFEDYRNFIKRR